MMTLVNPLLTPTSRCGEALAHIMLKLYKGHGWERRVGHTHMGASVE